MHMHLLTEIDRSQFLISESLTYAIVFFLDQRRGDQSRSSPDFIPLIPATPVGGRGEALQYKQDYMSKQGGEAITCQR